MIYLVLILNIFIMIIAITFALFFTAYFINIFFLDAPFVPVRKRVLTKIIDALELKPNSVLYDLGCGDGRVLLEAKESKKSIRIIGIEKYLVVYLITKWKTRKKSLEMHFGDALNMSIKDATHIYLYMYPAIINKLLPKIKRECKKGTRIVSCDFMFDGLTPDETIELPIEKDRLCKKLHVYVLK